jgi:hypothetical protein
MPAMLRLVPVTAAIFCPAWGCAMTLEPVHGARCCWCGREVAAPETARGLNVGCIYCGLDRGLLPAVEIEPGQPLPGWQ